MFQILTFTEARLATLTPRSETHGDEDVPAVSMGLEITTGNVILNQIDPKLAGTLFEALEDQPDLPGVERALTVLRCNSIDRVTLPTKHEGWTLAVDDGIDDTVPAVFTGCKLDKFSVEPSQGGIVCLRFRVGTSDLDAARSGMLGMHVGQPIWITLTAPKPADDAIDGTQAAFDADHPSTGEGDATDLFAQAHGGPGEEDDAGSEGGETDSGAALRAEGRALVDAWPLPDNNNNSLEAPPQSVVIETSRPGTRTARGREKTAAALEAGKGRTPNVELSGPQRPARKDEK